MGTTSVDEFLEHWGVKGMKWGIRNDIKNLKEAGRKSRNMGLVGKSKRNAEAGQPSKRQAKKVAKADTKWQKNIYTLGSAIAVHNHVADTMNNGEIDALNNTPKFKNHVDRGGKLLDPETGHPVGKIGQQYMDDYTSRVEKAHRTAISEIHGTSPSGKHKAELDTSNPNQWSVKVSPVSEAAHAVDGMGALMPEAKTTDKKKPTIITNVDHDPETGAIGTHAKIKTDDMEQSDPAGVFLTHWGVKGMKWGVRNDKKSSSSGSGKAAGTNNKPKAHELSDEDLKKHISRMELEKRYTDLASGKHSKSKGSGAAFAGELGKNLVRTAVTAAGTHAVNQALKKTVK